MAYAVPETLQQDNLLHRVGDVLEVYFNRSSG